MQKRPRILLILPPLTQLNTPYPSTAYLSGLLKARGYEVAQWDAGIDLVLKMFSREGLCELLKLTPLDAALQVELVEKIESVIAFLQGRKPDLAFRIAQGDFLPETPRLQKSDAEELQWAFGPLGITDKAKHLSSLFIDDLTDLIRDHVDARFSLSKYGEKLAASQPTFEPLAVALAQDETLLDRWLREMTLAKLTEHKPDLVGFSVPFPGNVYAAFRMAQTVKAQDPGVRTLLGGGYVNTELRELEDPRVFERFDYVTLDDGEVPFLSIASGDGKFLRTLVCEEGRVVFKSDPSLHDLPQKEVPPPDYAGLDLSKYFSLLELLNPMHRLWSDGKWLKLTLAHGCYWKKCNFCDVTLDYIGRYDPAPARLIVDKMEALMRETGLSGFHFVDEAAPPALLRGVSEEILRRGLVVTWWGNIRFEKAFTPELCGLLTRAGCIALTGGLEVASDPVLQKINKGVTVAQVKASTRAMSDAGIMVHAYLMYGFPGQTKRDTFQALGFVRELFQEGCIQSGFWHRFSATAHSPVGRSPDRFGIEIQEELLPQGLRRFGRNDLPFTEVSGIDHDRLGPGLNLALFNYMRGVGFDREPKSWFATGS